MPLRRGQASRIFRGRKETQDGKKVEPPKDGVCEIAWNLQKDGEVGQAVGKQSE